MHLLRRHGLFLGAQLGNPVHAFGSAEFIYRVSGLNTAKKGADLISQSPIRMFLAGIRCNPTIGVAPFSLFQAVSLYSCGFALILAIRLLISSSVGMSISPIAVK